MQVPDFEHSHASSSKHFERDTAINQRTCININYSSSHQSIDLLARIQHEIKVLDYLWPLPKITYYDQHSSNYRKELTIGMRQKNL